MQASTVGNWRRRWLGAESTPRRRALATMPLVMAMLAVWLAVAEWTSAGAASLLIPLVLAIGVGWFARTWLVVATTYVAAVVVFWLIEGSLLLWYGPSGWEARNAEHWQGTASVASKVAGQLLEYAVYGIFLLPFVAIGVLIGQVSRRARQHNRRVSLGV
jgi:hypothetical protein